MVISFLFSLIFIKNNNKIKIVFFEKNQDQTETGSNRPVSVRFFRKKSVQTSLVWFFRF
jgi:hypothetical protein